MLNRRLLRIKVLQALYAQMQDGEPNVKSGESFLLKLFNRVYDEYLFLLNLPLDIRYYVENEQNPEEILYVPSKRDIESGRTFIYNKLINLIDDCATLKKLSTKSPYNWQDHKDVMRLIFNGFKTSSYFAKYLDAPEKTFEVQKRLLLNFYQEFIPKHEEINNLLEDLFMHWNDDKRAVLSSIQKTLEQVKSENDSLALKPLSDNEKQDWEFCTELFKLTLNHNAEITNLIADKTQKWDTDRIAEIDLILMRMAVSEMLYFETIPVKVTINEYLDISKVYSTPKSSIFLNGVLDKIMNELKETGRIRKTGRGLLE